MIPLLVLFLAQSADTQCGLEGTVVNSLTGVPLAHARVNAWTVRNGTHSNSSSQTDDLGHFSIGNLDPGTYTLGATRSGFVDANYGAHTQSGSGTPLELAPAETIKDLRIELAPEAMIYGRVLDQNDDPVRGVSVEALRRVFGHSEARLLRIDQTMSQADGTFVLGGFASGTYYVCAMPSARATHTCFPNALNFSSATPIQVASGESFRGAEIRLQRTATYHIRGRIQIPAGAPENLQLQINVTNISDKDFGNSIGGSPREGKFDYAGFEPGTYRIQINPLPISITDPSTGTSATRYYGGKIDVVIADSDQDVVIPLSTGVEITGKIRVEGDAPDPSILRQFAGRGISMFAPSSYVASEVSPDGAFAFHGAFAETYHLSISNTPDGTYLKSVRFNQREIPGADLDLTSGIGGTLDIVLSPNPATLTGTVRDENGKPAAGAHVHLFLGDDFKRSATADQNGRFQFSSLAPGDYRAFAFEEIENGLSSERDFRKNLESRAGSVTLAEKSHDNLDLQLITRVEIEAAAAKNQ